MVFFLFNVRVSHMKTKLNLVLLNWCMYVTIYLEGTALLFGCNVTENNDEAEGV